MRRGTRIPAYVFGELSCTDIGAESTLKYVSNTCVHTVRLTKHLLLASDDLRTSDPGTGLPGSKSAPSSGGHPRRGSNILGRSLSLSKGRHRISKRGHFDISTSSMQACSMTTLRYAIFDCAQNYGTADDQPREIPSTNTEAAWHIVAKNIVASSLSTLLTEDNVPFVFDRPL